MKTKRSRIHPKFKTRYRVENWAKYDRSLVKRGDLTVWLSEDAIRAWTPERGGRRGAQRKYSELAIETAVAVRLVYGLPWRQTEGLLNSVLRLMDCELKAPDHTPLSRRSQTLETALRHRPEGPIHLIIDSTGLSICGEGEWARWKHGKGKGRRGWRKLHLGVDGAGFIVAQEISEISVADVSAVPVSLNSEQVDGHVHRFTADGAYDAESVFEAPGSRPIAPDAIVVPPQLGSLPGYIPAATWPWRPANINRIAEVGRRGWLRESGYHQQARVENSMYRYKRIIGAGLRAVNEDARKVEALVACNVLNRMLELGWPVSRAVRVQGR